MPVSASQKEGVHCFCITNENGVKLHIASLGATITALQLPDGYDKTSLIYLACEHLRFSYLERTLCLGTKILTVCVQASVSHVYTVQGFHVSVFMPPCRLSHQCSLHWLFSWASCKPHTRSQVFSRWEELPAVSQCGTTPPARGHQGISQGELSSQRREGSETALVTWMTVHRRTGVWCQKERIV